jgi:Predicted nucleic acid-binding protein, contains PIN domain
MIVLDTNVLSEALRPLPSPTVLGWLAAQQPLSVFTTTITEAEILYGAETLPPGKRRLRLLAAVERIFAEEFAGRILPFDEDAARAFAGIVAARDAAGRPISQFDAMIAAIARSHRAAVATRNTADFQHCGIDVINPWTE